MLFSHLKSSLLNESLSYEDAVSIFHKHAPDVDVESLSKDELKKLWRKISVKLHPDKNDGKDMGLGMLNSAYDTLKGSKKRDRGPHNGFHYQKEPRTDSRSQSGSEVPEWAWAGHSGGYPPNAHIARQDYTDKNYFMKRMWELSNKSKERWTIMAFDGRFFRSVLTVYGNDKIFKEMSKGMVVWNSESSNPYDTRAVFASKKGSNSLFLIYLDGKHLSSPIEFNHDSFNDNPANDRGFVRDLPQTLDDIAANGFKQPGKNTSK